MSPRAVNRWYRCRTLSEQCLQWTRRSSTSALRQQDEPLRILFCGSEGFSIAALEALRELQRRPDSNILSIDVATRKDKPGGRGMKEVRSPPIKRTAAQLGLRIHQFDTFTGWHLPEYGESPQPYINLIVAVSFGLLVPPRILKNAKFGGLNVHPSMLPEFRGAAPINWTILKGHSHTGVSLQTLHPSKFDHGIILDQTPEPGISIPNADSATAHELRHLLAPVGADMLVNAVRRKLYLQPHSAIQSKRPASMAPKISSSTKAFNPSDQQLPYILRANRAVPKLWAEAVVNAGGEEQRKRVILGTNMRAANMDDLPVQETRSIIDGVPIGVPFALLRPNEDVSLSSNPLFIKVRGDGILAVPDLLVAGGRERPSVSAAAQAKLFAEPEVQQNFTLYKFCKPLVVPEDSSKTVATSKSGTESAAVNAS